MNILEYNINQSLEEKVKPIFLMKSIIQQRLEKLERSLQKVFLEHVLDDLKTIYKNHPPWRICRRLIS